LLHGGVRPVAEAEVRGRAPQLLHPAPGEDEGTAALGQQAAQAAGDGRGCPEDQDALAHATLVLPANRPAASDTMPRRRACDELKRRPGSTWALTRRNSSRRGYIARNTSGVVIASLAR